MYTALFRQKVPSRPNTLGLHQHQYYPMSYRQNTMALINSERPNLVYTWSEVLSEVADVTFYTKSLPIIQS